MPNKNNSKISLKSINEKLEKFSSGFFISLIGLPFIVYGVIRLFQEKDVNCCYLGDYMPKIFAFLIFLFGYLLLICGLVNTVFHNWRNQQIKNRDEVFLIGLFIGLLISLGIALFLAWILNSSLTSMLTWILALAFGLGFPLGILLGILISIKLQSKKE